MLSVNWDIRELYSYTVCNQVNPDEYEYAIAWKMSKRNQWCLYDSPHCYTQ